MSYTDLGYSIFHGKKIIAAGYNTRKEAIEAAYRIAATKGYTYEYKAMLSDKWIKHRLAENWKTLKIKRGQDWGGCIDYRNEGTIDRETAEKQKAKPYPSKSNVKHLKKPKEIKRVFEKDGERFTYQEAYWERRNGLTIIYKGEISTKTINERLKEKLSLTEEGKKLLEEEEPETLEINYHITSADFAEKKWKPAGLSAKTFNEIERRAKE